MTQQTCTCKQHPPLTKRVLGCALGEELQYEICCTWCLNSSCPAFQGPPAVSVDPAAGGVPAHHQDVRGERSPPGPHDCQLPYPSPTDIAGFQHHPGGIAH